MNVASKSVDFIVPTLKRPEHLARCLTALSMQSDVQLRVFVGVREDDEVSVSVVSDFIQRMSVQVVVAKGVGVVGSMNSCLLRCSAPYIGLLDDDVELPPLWLSRMLDQLDHHPLAVAAGGRDILMDHPEMRRTEPCVLDVGTIHLYGRVTGNHHRGGGEPRLVDVLRGSNCLYRGDFLRSVGFEKGLAGAGAQVNWELALALQSASRGYKMLYDPTTTVIHHVAPRHDNDTVHRGIFDARGTADIAHNETLVALKHGRGTRRLVLLLWQSLIGSPTCPGMMRFGESLLRPTKPFMPRLWATLRGRLRAVSTWIYGVEHAA